MGGKAAGRPYDGLRMGNRSSTLPTPIWVPTRRSSAAHPVSVFRSLALRHSCRRYEPDVLPRMRSVLPAKILNWSM